MTSNLEARSNSHVVEPNVSGAKAQTYVAPEPLTGRFRIIADESRRSEAFIHPNDFDMVDSEAFLDDEKIANTSQEERTRLALTFNRELAISLSRRH